MTQPVRKTILGAFVVALSLFTLPVIASAGSYNDGGGYANGGYKNNSGGYVEEQYVVKKKCFYKRVRYYDERYYEYRYRRVKVCRDVY